MSSEMSKIKLILFDINREQCDAVKNLFAENGWPWKATVEHVNLGGPESVQQHCTAAGNTGENVFVCNEVLLAHVISVETDESDKGCTSQSASVNEQHANASAEAFAEPSCSSTSQTPADDGRTECAFCFCSPCVAQNRQSWLGNGQSPQVRNSGIRKKMYRKFWTMLEKRNAWRHPSYLRKNFLGLFLCVS